VTAAVTRATKVTGAVHGISGVKVGDEVSAQITGTASSLTATAIHDPAGNSSTSLHRPMVPSQSDECPGWPMA
jgi:hypothetical protein